MKTFYTIGLIILAQIITQPAFPQKENMKSTTDSDQQIELSEGYSFISSRIIAENPDMQDILQNNLANLEFVRNSQGFMLQKIGPVWVNNIGDWVNTEGYLFKMSSADELTINGDVIDQQTPIELSTGYQLIGYLPDEALNTEDVFQDVLENLDFVRNTEGFMFRKIGPVWVNSIGDMQPGEGYLVKMLADDILIYPGSSSFTCGDPFTDPRDGQTYTTEQIDTQCWMSENLNIGIMISGIYGNNQTNNSIIEKFCYDNNTINCDEYGGLYQWNEIMEYTTTPGVQGICPAGWHIPTDDELKTLEGTVDSQYPVGDPIWDNMGLRGFDAGLNLKSLSGWIPYGNGTDLYGFSALPGGSHSYAYGIFVYLGNFACFWSSTEFNTENAVGRLISYEFDGVNNAFTIKEDAVSVRCLKDETTPVNQPPEPPSSPNPEDEAVNQSIETDLSWTCIDPEVDPLTYDIYFGTEATPPQVATAQTETTYDPGVLEYDTEYFWKIVAHDIHTNTTEGPVWSFITETESTHQPCPGIPTITYEGQVYNTVLIGNQCWLKENLNVGLMINGTEEMTDNSVIEKYCYDDNPANCNEYGGLYQWNEMMQYSTTPGVQGICPAGWHIPIDDEWTILIDFLGGENVAGGKMKETGTTHWNSPNTGATNESGFTGLGGGYLSINGNFSSFGNTVFFWSSTEVIVSSAWIRPLYYSNTTASRDYTTKESGASVRCIKNETIW